MPFTVKRSPAELVVRQRGAGLSLLLGALVYAAAAWLLFHQSGIGEATRALDVKLEALLHLSVLLAGVILLVFGVLTIRYPVEVVLDKARNRILVRFHPGTAKLDFTGPLHEVARFDLVDVGTAVYGSLARAARQSQTPAWLSGLQEWAFRTSAAEDRFDAENALSIRLTRLFGKGRGALKPVRLRVTMRDGEEIMLDRLTGSPGRLRSLVQTLEDYQRGGDTTGAAGVRLP
jgi:hypothetical protein